MDGSMIGQKFGSLTVIGKGEQVKNTCKTGNSLITKVPCVCKCGTSFYITAGNLRKVVRCLKCAESMRGNARKTHGCLPKDVHSIWLTMNSRCNNPKVPCWIHYGGRGITVCERWRSFVNFRDDMGPKPSPKHTVERIDNSKGYSPENCRWATRKEQCRNKRNSRFITVGKETKTLSEWGEISPVSCLTIHKRLKRGWSAEDAVFKPSRKEVPQF